MKVFWEERFGSSDYIYGKEPNAFIKKCLDSELNIGDILFPAEGEGRNAVYAALKGWSVSAFDYAEQGKVKALTLADKAGVKINYQIADAKLYDYGSGRFDAAVLCFAHFQPELRVFVHKQVVKSLKKGGKIFLQGFNSAQLQFKSGGPKDEKMLYHLDMLKEDFSKLNIIHSEEKEVYLEEGIYHQGKASVIEMIGIKV